MDDLLNGVKGAAVAGEGGRESMWFSRSFSPFSLHDLAIVPDLGREHAQTAEIMDDVPNGGG